MGSQSSPASSAVVLLGLAQAAVYLGVGLAAGVRLESGFPGAVLLSLTALVSLGFGSLGAIAARRTGSGEAVQGLFPLFFVFLFLSSMNLPRNLIEIDWFRYVATANPVSYLIECVRSLVIVGWDAQALARWDSARRRDHRGRPDGRDRRPADEVDPLVRTIAVAEGIAWRTLHNVFKNPELLLPGLLFPLFFFVAFAGGLSRVEDVPGFEYGPGYTGFQFVFVLLQSAAFGGVFTGFGIARDFESGFSRRLLLAAPNRRDRAGLCDGRAHPLAPDRCDADHGRPRRGHGSRRQRDRPVRPLRARAHREPGRGPLGRRGRDAAPHDAGRARHADRSS